MESLGRGGDLFIELEAPPQLQPGQNFYDQPPFDKVLSLVAENGINKDRALAFVTSVAKTDCFYHPADLISNLPNSFKVPASLARRALKLLADYP